MKSRLRNVKSNKNLILMFRLHGFYEADQGLVQHQEQKLLDYRNLLNRASARFTHTTTRHHYS